MINSIFFNRIKQIANGTPKTNSGSNFPRLNSDTFEKSTNPFNNWSIEVSDSVPASIKNAFELKIKNTPFPMQKLFIKNGYKIIISDNIQDFCKKNGILANSEKLPTNILGLTYTSRNTGRKYFCFNSKTPAEHIGRVVNHEFGHGLCNIYNLDTNPEYIRLLSEDISEIITKRKLDNLMEEERKCLSHYFFNPKANLPINEIIADLFAWTLEDGGCYGSSLAQSKDNPKLMSFIFPRLSSKVSQVNLPQ